MLLGSVLAVAFASDLDGWIASHGGGSIVDIADKAPSTNARGLVVNRAAVAGQPDQSLQCLELRRRELDGLAESTCCVAMPLELDAAERLEASQVVDGRSACQPSAAVRECGGPIAASHRGS